MNKFQAIFKNKDANQFARLCLLFVLLLYIFFQAFNFMGLFAEEINCGAEDIIIKDQKAYYTANGYRFDNADCRSDEKAFEGIYSVKLTPEQPFGMSITMGTPKAKDVLEASVWFCENKVSEDAIDKPFLVATIGKNVFWKGTDEVLERKNGWAKLNLKIVIPEGVYHDPLMIFCWNKTKNEVYFDNMSIKQDNYWKFFR